MRKTIDDLVNDFLRRAECESLFKHFASPDQKRLFNQALGELLTIPATAAADSALHPTSDIYGETNNFWGDREERVETDSRDDVRLRGSVEVTIFRGGQVLAVNSRNFGGFCGVGGKVEAGETFEQAARRELMEETGCEALSITFVAGHTLDPIPGDDQTIKWYCAGFVVDIGDQEPRPNEPGTRPFWTTQEDMIQNSLFPEWYAWWFGVLERFSFTLSTTTTSEAAIEAAREWMNTHHASFETNEKREQALAAIISKHIPDAGEIERLREHLAQAREDAADAIKIANERAEDANRQMQRAFQYKRERDEVRANAIGEAIECVPNNWLDTLLTGPEAALPRHKYNYSPKDVERLLNAIRRRLELLNAGSGIVSEDDNEQDQHQAAS